MGQTSATARLAHFYCELYLRMRFAGVAQENRFDLELTQEELSDVLGLSLVHVNRSIKGLRAKELGVQSRGVMVHHRS
ncbi:helix-turn-helix domain-containing protein [Bosea sp. OAE506]|uniref:helix-turn-helix domain-containing protein n=1 Tax=Bosea sp. OAE506 TaxID=2663870 RepID=UPI00339290DF